MSAYAELHITSNFSFLRGGSHPHEYVERAKMLGLKAIALTDRNTLSGVVRAHVAAKELDLRFIIGCCLDLGDAPSLLCFPKDRAAYGRLSELLTLGQRRAGKGECHLTLDDVTRHAEGQIFVILPPFTMPDARFKADVKRIEAQLDGDLYLAANMSYQGEDRERLDALAAMGLPLVTSNDVHYHIRERRPLQDVVTSIREGCSIAEAGSLLAQNAERHLKSGEEMARLFKGHEDALSNSIKIMNSCHFSLDELKYEYPDEPVPEGKSPQKHLEDLSWEGAQARYPYGIPDKVQETLSRELKLIDQMDYAPYFLTVHDIVAWARAQNILCQGRGSAANSTVCYCLGVTAVDPTEVDLLFERFINTARREPPDIDVDFEHARREEVIQYIYARYGRARAGLTATVIHYRWRRAIREVGKVMGLTEDVTAVLAGIAWGSHRTEVSAERLQGAGLNPHDPHLKRIIELASELVGFPRHLSQHVGGFVLTRGPLSSLVPIGNAAMEDRTVIEWDKDDIDALGILKVDVLGLGMLHCIAKGLELLKNHYHKPYNLATIPREVPGVYDMLCKADAIGVFQVESRAQMAMLPRLKPRRFYDLVVEVAIVRPGPIQGDMVHPYLRRRSGEEAVTYPAPHPDHGPANELCQVLGKTCGVPLFQEQAMRLAIIAAEFTPEEANQLRRAMATFRRLGTIGTLRGKFVDGMTRRGYEQDFAERCFQMIEGFGDYGFPESHAASFAHLVYVSAWMKWAYPDVFACALLNAQPMGFYAPAQIVRDAREHGVEVRAVDINDSDWDNTLELIYGEDHALRLGLRQVSGMSEEEGRRIVDARGNGYPTLADVQRRARVSFKALEALAAADCFRSIGLDRRAALWEVRGLDKGAPLPLFDYAESDAIGEDLDVKLPEMNLGEHVVADYQTLRLSLKAHPMALLRTHFPKILPSIDLLKARDGDIVELCGLILVRQRPGTASGVIFITIEDETGIANLIVWPKVMEKFRPIVMAAKLLKVKGRVQKADGVIHIIAIDLSDESHVIFNLMEDGASQKQAAISHTSLARHPRDMRVIPNSRDFH